MSSRLRFRRAFTYVAVAACTVVGLQIASPSPADAAANCHYNTIPMGGIWGEVKYNGSSGSLRYPATLHGETIRLYSHSADASVRATVSGANSGDILSVDRSNFLVTGTAAHYFQTTAWVQARGTWDYCERTVSGGSATIQGVDGAHRYIRVCLRRSGALQCTNIWYGDNDDNTGDSTRIPG